MLFRRHSYQPCPVSEWGASGIEIGVSYYYPSFSCCLAMFFDSHRLNRASLPLGTLRALRVFALFVSKKTDIHEKRGKQETCLPLRMVTELDETPYVSYLTINLNRLLFKVKQSSHELPFKPDYGAVCETSPTGP